MIMGKFVVTPRGNPIVLLVDSAIETTADDQETAMDTTGKVQLAVAALRAGVEKLQSGDDWQRALDVQARFHNYSFGNCALIAMQRPDATGVAGFNAWRQLGRSVKKGEKGIQILAPAGVGRREVERADGTTD